MALVATLDVDERDVVTFPHVIHEPTGVSCGLSDRQIKLNKVGRHIVGRCDGTATLGQVVGSISDRFGIPRERARADLISFLEEADRDALIRVKRSWRARLAPLAVLLTVVNLLALRVNRAERRRYRPTASGCLAACVRALRLPVWQALLCAPLVFFVLSRQPRVPTVNAFLAALLPLAVVFFAIGTVWLHEIGHLVALPAPARSTAFFKSKSMMTMLVYDRTEAGIHAPVVALAGPLIAAATCLAFALAFDLAHVKAFATLVPLMIGAAHLCSLLPWAHDGRSLRRWFGARHTSKESADGRV